MNVGLTLVMQTDARDFIAVGESVFAELCKSERGRFGGGSVLVLGGIMGGNKTRLIVITGNINAQTYIIDVLAVEALPFIQFHGQNVTFMRDNARPHLAAITRQFLATNNVNVFDWPANSPYLNPIEQIWDELGRRVRRNHAIHTVKDLAADLQAEWSSMIMPGLAQFMRLLASVCVGCLVSRLLASASVCVGCLVSRLLASASARVCVRLRLLASVCVGRLVSRLCASASVCVCVCVRLRLCASVVLSRVCVRLRLLVNACGNWLIFVRLPASVVLSRVCVRLLVGTGSFYASVVIQRVQRWGELAQVFAICLASYYPLAVHIDYVDYMNRPLIF